jgi:hypothetical protein
MHGREEKEKAAKVATAKHLWTPAVNNSGDWGRWEFYEATDPWNLATELRDLLRNRRVDTAVNPARGKEQQGPRHENEFTCSTTAQLFGNLNSSSRRHKAGGKADRFRRVDTAVNCLTRLDRRLEAAVNRPVHGPIV